ncbi:hypothetical protein ACS0TY_008408 [Phlomoides rotata]
MYQMIAINKNSDHVFLLIKLKKMREEESDPLIPSLETRNQGERYNREDDHVMAVSWKARGSWAWLCL